MDREPANSSAWKSFPEKIHCGEACDRHVICLFHDLILNEETTHWKYK